MLFDSCLYFDLAYIFRLSLLHIELVARYQTRMVIISHSVVILLRLLLIALEMLDMTDYVMHYFTYVVLIVVFRLFGPRDQFLLTVTIRGVWM